MLQARLGVGRVRPRSDAPPFLQVSEYTPRVCGAHDKAMMEQVAKPSAVWCGCIFAHSLALFCFKLDDCFHSHRLFELHHI
mmetsp:Transcript_87757/g.183450  ORF Transcript_87757/g.183450 Transcript_87757/m.183450 type:complete len:81 (+) Transcript_87757:807-1049(+)